MLRFADKSLKDWELSYQKVNKGTQKVILVLFSFFFFFLQDLNSLRNYSFNF